MISFRQARGDTIVEVMFSTAVAGLVIVLAMGIMNRGVATSQMALEHTLVRQGIDGQADSLRYLRDTSDAGSNISSADWTLIKSKAQNSASVYSDLCNPAAAPPNSFYIQLNDTAVSEDQVVVQGYGGGGVAGSSFATPGNGMWIEAVKSASDKFIDFHIRACWEPPFSGPKASMGTIVRLYD